MTYERAGVHPGAEFGLWAILGWQFRNGRHWFAVARCDCGKVKVVRTDHLCSKQTTSCGCHKPGKVTHGMSETLLYNRWLSMKGRCHRSTDPAYADYGGRGIRVCEAWKNDFAEFAKWALSSGYQEGLEIDRIDNDSGYLPGNCRWVTRLENMNNTRTTKRVEAFGEVKTVTQWISDNRCVVGRGTLMSRLFAGWEPEDALTFCPDGSKSYRRDKAAWAACKEVIE